MKIALHISEDEFDELVKEHPEFKDKHQLADYLNDIQPVEPEIDFVVVERDNGDSFTIYRGEKKGDLI